MKYLSYRDNYLKKVNEINQLKIQQRFDTLTNQLINEENSPGAGAFENNVKWGDCLLGRFLHNTIRKAQVAANLARMKPVISRLRGAMDDLLVAEQLNDLSEVDKAELNKALASEYIDVLQQAIDGFANADKSDLYYKLEGIQNLTSDTIEKLKGTSATPYLGTAFEGKNEILRQLEKFKEEIDEWIEYAPVKKDSSSTTTQQQQQQVTPASQHALGVYQLNFLALINLVLAWDKINRLKGLLIKLTQAKQAASTSQNPQDKVNKEAEVVKIEAEIKGVINESFNYNGYEFIFESEEGTEVDKKYKELLQIWIESQKKAGKTNLKPGEGTRAKLMRQAQDEVKKKPVVSGDDNKNQPSIVDTEISKIMKQIWNLLLVKQNKKILSDYAIGFDKLKSDDRQGNAQIRKVYDGIRKKLSLSIEEAKNESIANVILDTDKISSLIIELYNKLKPVNGAITLEMVGIKIPDGSVSFKSVELKEELKGEFKEFLDCSKEFYSSMSDCLVGELYVSKTEDVKSEEPQGQSQEEAQKESFIFKYNHFLNEKVKGINKTQENDDADPDNQHPIGDNRGKMIYTVGDGAKTDDRPELATDLKSAWTKIFPNISKYVLTKQQAEQLKESLDKKLTSQKDSIIIMGMDPVLEIVKCFNRAYKIHTKQVIPSGRSGGEVTNKIFMEYTCFGSGSPANAGVGGGPYRNNRLFDLWESSVLDIMKDKQYQKIFNNGTRLKVGDEYIEKAGANLRKFMSDMLNGDEFYGKGDGGKEGGLQAKFLDKYFGYKDGDDAKNTHFGGSEEREVNIANTPEPMKIVLESAKSKKRAVPKNLKDLIGTFFAVKMSISGYNRTKVETPSTFYFFIQDVDDSGNLYATFVQTGYFMKEYLGASGQTVQLDGSIKKDEYDSSGQPWIIGATKVPFKKFFTPDGGSINATQIQNISYLIKENPDREKARTLNDPKRPNEKVSDVKFNGIEVFHVIDESKDDRAKVSNLGKIDAITERENGGYLKSTIKKVVTDAGVQIPL